MYCGKVSSSWSWWWSCIISSSSSSSWRRSIKVYSVITHHYQWSFLLSSSSSSTSSHSIPEHPHHCPPPHRPNVSAVRHHDHPFSPTRQGRYHCCQVSWSWFVFISSSSSSSERQSIKVYSAARQRLVLVKTLSHIELFMSAKNHFLASPVAYLLKGPQFYKSTIQICDTLETNLSNAKSALTLPQNQAVWNDTIVLYTVIWDLTSILLFAMF